MAEYDDWTVRRVQKRIQPPVRVGLLGSGIIDEKKLAIGVREAASEK